MSNICSISFEFPQHLPGIASALLELLPTLSFRGKLNLMNSSDAIENLAIDLKPSRKTGHVLWRSYSYLKPYFKTILAAYAALMGATVLSLIIPQIISWIIDRGIRDGQTSLLIWAALGLLGINLIKAVLTFLEGRWSEVASQNVAYDVRNDITHKLTLLSFSFHDQTEKGDLLARAIQDVERIRFLTGRATVRIISAVTMLAGTAGFLIWMNPKLALLVSVAFPVLIFISLQFGRRFRPLSLAIQKQLGVVTTVVEQNLRGAQIVKAFAQENREIERFQKENDHWFSLSAFAARMQSFNQPLLLLIANLGTVAIIWYGGHLVIAEQLSLGEMVAFTAYLGQLVDPIRRLGMIIPAIIIAGSASERIFDILDSVPDVKDAQGAQKIPPIQGAVRFENVSFSYGTHQVLRDIDFEAKPGEVIALLGATGSGKSSIANLIPRFYDPTSGIVLVDGLDLRSVTLNSLRSQIGIVLQETVLFSGTVRENLIFGCENCTEADLTAAAQAAQAHNFIIQMPKGYETRVGERGVTLSGGQKQRLAIARAMLMNPRILILDDATASVDSETEQLIQLALEKLMEGRTTFVIAHRLSTVIRADQILVLEHGQIVARGRHIELLESSPLYAEIYARQLAPAEGRS